MPCDRRHTGRRHTDGGKCQKCSKKNCDMHHCSDEYRSFYERQQEIESELKIIFTSIKEILNSHQSY